MFRSGQSRPAPRGQRRSGGVGYALSRNTVLRLTATPKTPAMRAPARSASARPTAASVDRSRSVRRPYRRVNPATCSTNVRRSHNAFSHMNRRTCRHSRTRFPALGAGAGRSEFAALVCGFSLMCPRRDHAALVAPAGRPGRLAAACRAGDRGRRHGVTGSPGRASPLARKGLPGPDVSGRRARGSADGAGPGRRRRSRTRARRAGAGAGCSPTPRWRCPARRR